VGALNTFTDTPLTNGIDYYYEIFARDGCVNWSTGLETGPHRPDATTRVSHATPLLLPDARTQSRQIDLERSRSVRRHDTRPDVTNAPRCDKRAGM
jgi:hypothetical protein